MAPRQVNVSNWPHFSSRLIFAIFAETKASLSFDIIYLLNNLMIVLLFLFHQGQT